ncbi:hypothetical protein B0H13DRAFT_2042386 [Mycena leptocephala]|nr:hypothetical protein B0H13DRAFT_2042386 [Mycena leptocephala]
MVHQLVGSPKSFGSVQGSATFSLTQLPRELILEIYQHLPESDLLSLCEVDFLTNELALLAALRGNAPLGSPQPVSGSLGSRLHFIDGGVNHLLITLSFPKPDSGFMKLFPPSVTRIVGGAALRPILIINFLTGICIRPQRAAPSVGATAPPAVDKGKFTRAIQSSLAATIKHQPHPVIHVLSFPQPTAPLGALVAINPNFILFLDMDAKVASPSEWQLFMPQLDLPSLRTLRIQVDLDYYALSSFLDRHDKIEQLDFRCDWSGLCNERPPPFPKVPNLKHISASSGMIRLALRTNNFPHLQSVSIIGLDSVPACSSVNHLIIQLHSAEPPWKHFDVATDSRAARELRHIRKLHISPWTREAETDGFPHWLAMFSGLVTLEISGDLFPTAKGPLVSEQLRKAISTVCPHVALRRNSVSYNVRIFMRLCAG